MTRDLGVVGAVGRLLPEGSGPALSLVTQLGDVWFVVALAAGVYWFRDRRGGAVLLGTVLAGLAATVALKAAFAMPRPPAAGRLVEADGYGFPSGHAIAATVAWGGLAILEDAWTRRGRAAAAAVAIVLVAASRVALGVHFLVDVVAGIAVGLVVLGAVVRWAADPARALAAAAGIAALAVAATGGGRDALLLLGAAAGGLGAWRLADVPATPWGRGGALPAVAGGLGVGGLFLWGHAAAPVAAAPLLGVVGGALLVGLPALR